MKNILAVFGLLLLAASCGNKETIYFDKPQPENVSDLDGIPSSYIGRYIGKDSSVLSIDKRLIVKQSVKVWAISKNEIDTSEVVFLNGNVVLDKKRNEKYRTRVTKDSIYLYENVRDTLFSLDDGSVIRKYKRVLVLNEKHSDDLWNVKLLKLRGGVLRVMDIESKKIFNRLAAELDNEVVRDSAQKDTLKMILKPTKKQFKKILKLEDSLTKSEYRKVR
ncbi:hypothetical protein [uncultured Acetobacteroides sp.]|uniref:hypothetical protein n=1 Tax=uncultured Acetobacteroides sp. TaxID=1760811 RepID=UPI0029F5B3CB|nr:hypothetical protein [uncultured Acetobacteroides sp.]